MRGALIGVVCFLLSSSRRYCSMDVCDAATGLVITGLLNPDCTDKLTRHGLEVRYVLRRPGVCVRPPVQKVFR